MKRSGHRKCIQSTDDHPASLLQAHRMHTQGSSHHLFCYNVALNRFIWPPALQFEVSGDKVPSRGLLLPPLSDPIRPLTAVLPAM